MTSDTSSFARQLVVTVFGGTFVLVAGGMSSWCYFALVGFPKEIQRVEKGDYSVVAYAEPTSRLNPLLMSGVLFNNTSVSVALFRNGAKVQEVELLNGEDRPSYHLPLEATWGTGGVEIREPTQGRSVFLAFPVGGA